MDGTSKNCAVDLTGFSDGTSKNCAVDLTGDDSKVGELDADECVAEAFDMEACCNFGPPIKVEWDGKTHDFVDGFWNVLTYQVGPSV